MSRFGLPEEMVQGSRWVLQDGSFPKHPAMLEQADTRPGPVCHGGTCKRLQQQFSSGRKVFSCHSHNQALVVVAECSLGTQIRFLLIKMKQRISSDC